MKKLSTIIAILLFAAGMSAQVTITNIYVSASTSTTATINWTTSGPATSQILYGTTPSMPFSNAVDRNLVTSHSMTLILLNAAQLYYFAPVSVDGAGHSTQGATTNFGLCGQPFTPVTGTVNNYYEYGSFTMTWVPPSGSGAAPTVCGQAMPTTVTGSLSGSGSLSASVGDAYRAVPGPGTWQITVNDVGTLAPITINFPVSFQSNDVSQQLQAAAATAGLVGVLANTNSNTCFPAFVCSGGGGGAVLKTNNVNNLSQGLLNFTNANGFTFSNPSGGLEEVGVDGTHFLPLNTSGTSCFWNGGGTCTTPIGGVSSVTGAAGNRADSITPTTGAVVVTNFDQQLYASQFATIPLLITACGGVNTKITVDTAQSFTLSGNQTFPTNCAFNFTQQGVWTVAGAFTLTFNGTVTANASQHFSGAATIAGLSGAVLPEWFGAIAYPLSSSAVATAAAGPNDATKMAAAIASVAGHGWVELRCYAYHFDTVAITTSNTGIIGDCPGYIVTSPLGLGTVIVSNAPSAGTSVVTAIGTSSAAYLTNVTLQGFSVQSAVVPVSPAACVYGQYIDQFSVVNVNAGDCFYDLYTNFTPSSSHGGITGFGAFWGESVVAGSSLPSGLVGIFQDSANNLGGSSLHINQGQAACQLVGAKATGILSSGISVTDTYIDGFATAGCAHGIDLENTGTSGFVAQDVLLTGNVLNNCVTDCLKINGMQSASDIAPHVYVKGGNMFPTGTNAVGAFIENSTNVALCGVQIFGGGATNIDVLLSSVDGFTVCDNSIDGGELVAISLLNSSHGTVTGNQIKQASSGVGIKNVGVTLVSEQGNSIAGQPGIANLTTGISFDSGSSNNGPWSLNNIDAATVTTPVTDAGTNNNTLKPTILTLNGSTPMTSTSSATSQIVTCTTGGTGSQFCGADGAWHSAAGAGTVTSIATTSPLSGGTITTSGTLSCPTCVTSAASLTANALLLGAGGQASAALGSLGTTTTVLHGNAAGVPSFGAVSLTLDVSGVLPIANGGTGSATVATHTVFGNPTGGTAAPTFTNAPVLTSVTVGNNLFNTTGISTSGNDFNFNISSANLFLAQASGATIVQIPAGNTFELGALSGCLSADATTHIVTGNSIATCGTVTTSGTPTTGFFPLFTAAKVIGNSHLDDGITTPGVITASENFVALAGTFSAGILSTLATSGANTFSGEVVINFAPIASFPAFQTTGLPFSGTGTTSVPLMYLNSTGTAPTTWSTASTYFGINAPLGYTGNFMDFHLNGGASLAKLDASGNLTVASCTGCGGGTGFPITIGSTSVAASSTTTSISGLTLVSPTFSGTVVGANTIPLSILAQSGANTMLGNWTSGTANVVANAMPSCSTSASALNYTTSTGIGCNTSINAATLGGNTFASPAAIGTGTPAAGTFTNVTDSALTQGQQVVAGTSGILANGGTAILVCSDTSASGTAQTCTTSPSFTPAANSCVTYTTTTPNSGAGLTLNVNGLGAKSVAKWLGTTTLAVGDVAANSPQLACYTGTVWNLSTIGNAPSGGGGTTWNAITNPTGNLSLTMAADTSLFTYGSTTSTANLWEMTDGSANTGTGLLVDLHTGATSTLNPFAAYAKGTTTPGLYVNSSNNVGVHTTGSTTVALNIGTARTAAEGLQFDSDATANLYSPFGGAIRTDGGFVAIGGVTTNSLGAQAFGSGLVFSSNSFGGSSGTAFSFAGSIAGIAAGVYTQLGLSGTTNFVGTTTGSWTGISNTGVYGSGTSNVYNGSAPIEPLNISPTINVATTSTNGYRAVNVNVTETSVSTQTNFLDWEGVGGTARYTLDNKGAGIYSGTVTSALGNAAITSATGGTGVTSVTCATATCTVSRGSYTVVGGTATTGTIVTLVWPTTTTAWVCSVDMNGGTGFLGIGHSVATATGMNITAGLTVVGVTFIVDYNCVP